MTISIEDQRFVIGIDLGTTNCAVSYVDLEEHPSAGDGIRIFKIPQLTGPGQVNSLPLLPSFLYIPGEYDLTEDAIVRFWDSDEDNIVDAQHNLKGRQGNQRQPDIRIGQPCHVNVPFRLQV